MVTWELTKINNEFVPNIDHIDTNALQEPAYIVPTYRSKIILYLIIDWILRKTFFLLPINIIDRNDWVEMTATQPLTSDELEPCPGGPCHQVTSSSTNLYCPEDMTTRVLTKLLMIVIMIPVMMMMTMIMIMLLND